MTLSDYKISGSEINTNGVVSAPDILTGTTQENKAIFDKLPTLITNKFNALIDSLSASGAAEIGSQPFDEITAKNIQDALKQIRDLIGSYYIGEDGAGKVGYTPSEGVDEDTVQEAIEAVQANLAAYIAKIKAATGAAEVGNAPIVGMTATNVQHALEELRKNIDNIVSGIIPGGSITSDMLQDGAVTADKLGSDVTGDTIPTSASDPTTISSQLSNLNTLVGGATTPQGALANLGAGVRPNLLDNWYFTGGGSQQGGGQFPINQRGETSYDTVSDYGIDRWLYGTFALTPQGLKLSSATTLYQRLANTEIFTGKTLTYSVLWSDGKLLTITGTPDQEQGVNDGDRAIGFDIDGSLSVLWVSIQSLDATEKTAVAAKLEFGDQQTLAYQDDTGAWQLLPQPESDYATQLAKCQRYYQIYSTADARPSKAVDCRPVMRTGPAQGTIVVGDTTYYYNTAEL